MVLEEFAGYVPSWVPGKAVPGEMTCQRHSAAKLHHLLLENLHLLQETGAGEAALVGVGGSWRSQAYCSQVGMPEPGTEAFTPAESFQCSLDKA